MFLKTKPENTARYILNLVKNMSSSQFRFFRRLAEQILLTNLNNQNNSVQEIIYIGNTLRSYVRYTLEPDDVETVKTPLGIMRDLYNYGILLGDCDDFTLFINCIFYTLGYNIGCKIVKQNNDDYFSHIYPIVESSDGQRIAVDLCTSKSIGYEYNDIITDYKTYFIDEE